jgi:hypothetical protein
MQEHQDLFSDRDRLVVEDLLSLLHVLGAGLWPRDCRLDKVSGLNIS